MTKRKPKVTEELVIEEVKEQPQEEFDASTAHFLASLLGLDKELATLKGKVDTLEKFIMKGDK